MYRDSIPHMKYLILTLLLVVAAPTPASGQASTELEWRPVAWAFPKERMKTKDINGIKAYELGKEVYGAVGDFEGKVFRMIVLPDNIILAAERVHRADPKGMPDVDQFLTAYAVSLAVESPDGYHNEPLGRGPMDGKMTYIFKTKSGANVGAFLSENRKIITILPAPSMKD
jgi:hypothetical protein